MDSNTQDGLLNIERFYQARYREAVNFWDNSEFKKARDICFELLGEPYLPLAWRAGANLLVSTMSQAETGIQFAKEAIKLYEEMIEGDPDDDLLKRQLQMAKDQLTSIEQNPPPPGLWDDTDEDENDAGDVQHGSGEAQSNANKESTKQ